MRAPLRGRRGYGIVRRMDFTLSEEERAYRGELRRFTTKVLAPHHQSDDKAAKPLTPEDALKRVGDKVTVEMEVRASKNALAKKYGFNIFVRDQSNGVVNLVRS